MILGLHCDHCLLAGLYGEVMSSKVAVIVSLLFVLAIGGAALAVNTRILNSSPQPNIGRANEVLVPAGAPPATLPGPPVVSSVVAPPTATAPPPTIAPSTRDEEQPSGDRGEADEAELEPDD
jgi:hypothetical protein